jgi:hypothetical protein
MLGNGKLLAIHNIITNRTIESEPKRRPQQRRMTVGNKKQRSREGTLFGRV